MSYGRDYDLKFQEYLTNNVVAKYHTVTFKEKAYLLPKIVGFWSTSGQDKESWDKAI